MDQLKKQLAEKEKALDEVLADFQEIKGSYEKIDLKLQKKDLELESLKTNLKMKSEQLDTLNSLMENKDDMIQTLKNTISMKDQQIETLKQTLDVKKDEMTALKSDAGNQELEKALEEKEKEIQKLNEEIKILNMDIKMSDEEVAELSKQLEEAAGTGSASGNSNILSNNVNRDQIIDFMIEMLGRSLHNVNITTPSILDLAELQLYDIRGSVNVKASCAVDLGDPEHQELLQEFDALDNISIRNFDENDRWVCLKDSEEMFIAAIGEKSNNLAFFSEDSNHIKLFNSVIMESWLRARKI